MHAAHVSHVPASQDFVERRRYERIPFFCEASVTTLPDGPTFPARTVDVSLGGVGLVAGIALERGQIVSICFSFRDPDGAEKPERMIGRVAYLRVDTDANQIGVEFFELLNRASSPRLLSRILKV